MATGAEALLRTLLDAGVDTCFANPGTSEMHFVAALDGAPAMRVVPTLFEGVATGAADGYARMAERPAATLLHLGCGLGNGLANLHNARKGRVPVVNLVGAHAAGHERFDTPLQSDIETAARQVSGWVRTCGAVDAIGRDTAEAVAAALGPPGQVATLIVPADVSWSEGGMPAKMPPACGGPCAADDVVDGVARVLRGGRNALVLGGAALRGPALLAAARIAAATGARLFAEVFPARMERGAGRPPVERLAYLGEMVAVQLAGLDNLVLVGAARPASFFAYPGRESDLVPPGCAVHVLATAAVDAAASLDRLCVRLGAGYVAPKLQAARRSGRPRGRLTAEKVCKAVGHLLPEGAIVVDEAQTSGTMLPWFTAGAPHHDLLTLTGGAIGQGLPAAAGAAIACPDRPVLALVGDGAAMYTIQALWTMAREGTHVVSVVFNNHAYAILELELQRVGVGPPGPRAEALLDLASPGLDFARIAAGMGVPAVRATTAEAFTTALERALAEPGPHLIEAVVPPAFSGWKLRAMPWLLRTLGQVPGPVARALKRRVAP